MERGRSKRQGKKKIEAYDHPDKKRANNPPVGLVTPQTDPDEGKRREYAYDPHLDPQLTWAGKAERTSFEIPTVSLHVHERIEPRTILEAVRKRNGDGSETQGFLFDAPDENLPLRAALDFYSHPHGWSNRLIAGDSLLVMNSLLEKEGLGGQMQMVYVDPPLRDQVRLELPAIRQQARRQGRERRGPHAGARDDPRLSRHLGVRDPLVFDVPPRSLAFDEGTAHGEWVETDAYDIARRLRTPQDAL